LPAPTGGLMGGQPAGLTLAGGTVPHGTIARAQIILRAQQWLSEHVPYSQTSWWTDANGTYRQDCSGYVSMAWGLPQNLDFWTGNLATVSNQIPAADLKPGDVLLNAVHHVVLFAGWADATHTTFNLYEEAHTGTDTRYVVDAPLTGYLASGFVPYRYDGVLDTAGETLPNAPTAGAVYATLGANELDPAGVQKPPNLNSVSAARLASLEHRLFLPKATTSPASVRVTDAAGLAASSGDDTAGIAAGATLSAAVAGLLVGGVLYGRRRPVGRRRR
jgi:hypothetical protein